LNSTLNDTSKNPLTKFLNSKNNSMQDPSRSMAQSDGGLVTET